MLKSFLKYLPGLSVNAGTDAGLAVPLSSVLQVREGYHAPVSAQDQLAMPRRAQWLQMLWDYSSLPKNLYQRYYLHPLERCVTLMQQFPATENGHHAHLGGMVDHLLETVAYAARLSKNYLLPMGAPPEEQATQSTAWNAVIVYAAMVQSLDGLCQIEVELESGRRWMPLNVAPGEPYRFRFVPVADALQVQSLNAMLAWKIIPDEALLWLSTWPEVLKALSLYLTGFRNESGIVNAIVMDAVRASVGKTTATPGAILSMPGTTMNSGQVLPGSAPPAEILTAGPSMTLASALPSVACPPMSAEQVIEPCSPGQTLSPPEIMTPIPLATSLDSAVTHADLGSSLGKPCEEDATEDLLTIMGFPSPEDVRMAGEPETVGTLPGSIDVGDAFHQWLRKCLLAQEIDVNGENSPVHILAGHVFVRSPAIFYQFISENKLLVEEQSCDWRKIQKQFEKMKLHKRQADGTNVYRCQEKSGGKSFNGYLIPAVKMYGGVKPPADSSVMVIGG
ncbi:TraI domain-containing protein [Serratia fonticola]|uniref:TraI domain-containing protein n=1 Tax=Serratia fonticola TaxID=47917 RepID=A0AAW3WLH5_SERFO|nr:TraI domain-containing protein [Serratia fonticola]MBC3211028.1 TraI domain-containing protein [Serratia fonticola]NYA12010.1 TraI domain-containing protein [Serratia fonticola]NYA31589.1 TraI domain-containing protein [Serratia fonticola]